MLICVWNWMPVDCCCSLYYRITTIQFSSVAQSYLTLCNPMDCNMPGLSVHHQHLEFTQTHVHWVRDSIQPSHPLLSSSPPAFNLSQHQGLFKWVSSLHQVAKVLVSASASVLPMNIQDWFPLGWTSLISLKSKEFSRVFSNSTVQKHQFFGAQRSLWSSSYIHTLLEKTAFFNIYKKCAKPRKRCRERPFQEEKDIDDRIGKKKKKKKSEICLEYI